MKKKWVRADAEKVVAEVTRRLEGYDQMAVCGSFRRGLKKVGDLDVVVVPNALDVLQASIQAMASETLASGSKLMRIVVANGMQVDFLFVDKGNFESACLHLTGSKFFNIKCRQIAKTLGFRLSQYGLLDEQGVKVAGGENEILEYLGMARFCNPSRRSL